MGALVLAEHGRRVLLVEAAERIGGAMRTDELTLPGFRHDVGAAVLPLALASPAFRHLRLTDDEVRWAHPPVAGRASTRGRRRRSRASRPRPNRRRTGPRRAGLAAAGRASIGRQTLVDALLSPLSPGAVLRAAPGLVRYGATGALPASVLARLAFREPRARAALAGMAAHSVLSLRAPSSAGYGTFLAGLVHSAGWPVVVGGTENLAHRARRPAREARRRDPDGNDRA